ncbi:MAG: prephenate dehydrogenase/arogenate dehydrogenase family protein [Armatimonadetes bacterium]|nr:prephenate dehydrogenase/arogenate dehydrogenase family protein [Armatimonadota bacterium]
MAGNPPPHFDRAAVIGIGLIGASFALAAKKAGVVSRVVGVARRKETLDAAVAVGAADETTVDPAEAAAGADLLYVATHVGTAAEIFRRVAPVLKPGCLVTDAGSVKAEVCRAAEQLLPKTVWFVGGHPMAGSEQSGPKAARVDLFRQHPYFLVATRLGGAEAVRRMEAVVEAIGARPMTVGAEEHDRILAVTSHLPHAAAVAVILAVEELLPDAAVRRDYSGAGLRDTTRVAAGSPEMWRDVLAANAAPVAEACRLTAAKLQALADLLAAGDIEGVAAVLTQAQAARQKLDEKEA